MALPKNLLLQDILKIYFSTTLTLKHQSLPFKELYYIFLQEIEYPSPVKMLNAKGKCEAHYSSSCWDCFALL